MTQNASPTENPLPLSLSESAASRGSSRRIVVGVAFCTALFLALPPSSAVTGPRNISSASDATSVVTSTSAGIVAPAPPRPLPVALAANRPVAAARQGTVQLAQLPVAVACNLVSGLRLCSHGDDAQLHPATAAGEGSDSQASTSSTRIGCYGDGRSGARVQTIYARPLGAADRLSEMQASFRGWAGAIEKAVDDSAHQTGGARHVRFMTRSSGSGCVLDVLSVTLPSDAFSSFAATVSALQQKGLHAGNVKYLVWSDATGYCGMASAYEDSTAGVGNDNNGEFPAYARVDRKCWGYAETHELVHMLGGVQKDAPNATAGYHCRDGSDVMCYADGTAGSRQVAVCGSEQARLLDCRHDDYFSTSPPAGSWLSKHWNLANSSFMSPGWTDPTRAAAPDSAPADTTENTAPSQPSAAPSPSPSPSPSPLISVLTRLLPRLP